MAGSEKAPGELEGLESGDAADANFSDQKFEGNDEHINVEDTSELDRTTGEERERPESLKTNQLLEDLHDDEQNQENQNGPQPATNTESESADIENDIDVASIEEADQPEDAEINGEEPENHVKTAQSKSSESEPLAEAQSEQNDRFVRLPLTRIKHIIKMDPEVTLASHEAVITIAKAAEFFISTLVRDASYKTIQRKRRVVLRKDLEYAMDSRDCYSFLEGAVQ
ncbi:hypothetical protein ACOMHN_025367 [Nucella lapillus]